MPGVEVPAAAAAADDGYFPYTTVKKVKKAKAAMLAAADEVEAGETKRKSRKEPQQQLMADSNGAGPSWKAEATAQQLANGGDEGGGKNKKRKSFPGGAPESSPNESFKRAKAGNGDENGRVEQDTDPNSVSNFSICKALREKLRSKGIETLFPIQAQTFKSVFDGKDLVGRARTGQGKTLAFVLPILESLTKEGNDDHRRHGRSPSVIVLSPTRELAKQIHADFEFYGASVGLKTVAVYGGAPMGPQSNALRRGVDIVVGTPGRIKDLMNRGSLNLKTLKFRVLDEADEMLNMGFVEDVETILGGVEDSSTVQTLLFSATLPAWVKKIADKFLKKVKVVVDLVGDEKMKASAAVRHLLMPCGFHARSQVVTDTISCYGSGGRCIIFTETKNDASQLAGDLALGSAKALHGDISQNIREATLAAFRSGKFTTLVATDVAARGLDINDVQLVMQCEPPRDAETYIHRSGRTGRAGKLGISVMLFDRKKEYMIPQIERKAGFKFERIHAPQPADIAKASCSTAVESLRCVSDSVIPLFKGAAQELIDGGGSLGAVDLLAKALAKITGHTEVKRRSLFTSHDDATTLWLKSNSSIFTPTYAFNCLRKFLSEQAIAEVRRMQVTADGKGAVFDVKPALVEKFVEGAGGDAGFTIEICEHVPELQARPERDNNQSRGGYGGRGRGGGYGGGRNFGGPRRQW